MQVKVIRKQRNFYALFFAFSTFPAVWLGAIAKTEAAIAIGTVSVAFLILLIKKNRLLYDATLIWDNRILAESRIIEQTTLIWDNRILAVSSALISTTGGTGQSHTEETVVSTFGILIGTKIYRWGLDGVHGVRLSNIEIDRQRMILIFGDATRSMRIELLHGITDQTEILEAKQKFWHETGVSANINGW